MKPKVLILLTVIAILFLIQFSSIFINKGLWWDETVYIGLSENLRENGIYSLNIEYPVESYRAPLFPMIGAVLGVNSSNILYSRIVPYFFLLVSVIFIYKAGKEIFNSKPMGIVSALFLISFPLLVYYSNKFLSESLFTALFSISIYLFSRKDKKYTSLLGISLGLCFLTRYIGIILLFLFSLWFLKEKRFKSLTYLLAGFLLCISPWLVFNYFTFGNPGWGFFANFRIYSTMTEKPLLYYFTNSYKIFGPLSLVMILSYLVLFKKSLSEGLDFREKFILFFSVVIFLIFTLLPNKNTRYMVSFYPIFSLVGTLLYRKISSYKGNISSLAFLFIIILSVGSFYSGYYLCMRDWDSGKALKNAGFYLRENTSKEDKVLTQLYSYHYPEWNLSTVNPWVRVLGKREPVLFPKKKKKVFEILEAGVNYVLIYKFDPRIPDYSENLVKQGEFKKIATFKQWDNEEAVIIYKYEA